MGVLDILRKLDACGDAWAAARLSKDDFADAAALDRYVKAHGWRIAAASLVLAALGAIAGFWGGRLAGAGHRRRSGARGLRHRLRPLRAGSPRARRIPPPPRLKMLQASVGSAVRLIDVDEVLYFQSGSKYTRVVTREGESLVKKTLQEIMAEVDPERYWQVHRGTVVNVKAIAAVNADELGHREIVLKDHPDRLEVSRSFAHLFRGA